MAANQEEFGAALKQNLLPVFENYGLFLDTLVVQNVSLPEELQKVLDTRISMNVIGDIDQYTRYQVASSIPLAAQNEDGLAGIGAGLGVRVDIGKAFTKSMEPAHSLRQQLTDRQISRGCDGDFRKATRLDDQGHTLL